MNACSIKGTPYEKEYEGFLKPSSIIFVWNKNNEQPLDKIKVGDEVIDNPLYQELMAHPITKGNRTEALKIIADTFFADFTSKYHKNDSGNYNLNQVLDYIEQRQRIQEDILSQKIQSVNIPTNRAINFYNANIGGIPVEVHFTEAESQEIFETFEYLLGSTNSWAEAQKAILDQKNTLVSQLDPKNVLPSQVKQIKALTEIADNFELFKEWYLSQDTVVGVDEGAADIGEGEDWTNKGQKERSSKRILGLVTSLPSYRRAATGEFNFDANRPYNSDERVLIKGGLLGLPKSGDFQRNWNLISTALSGITDYTKQYDAISDLAITHPQFNLLLKRLPDPRVKGSLKTIKQIMFAMGLKRIFSNPEIIAVSVNINNENNLGIVTQQIKGYRNTKNLFSQLDKQYFAFNPDYAIQGENGVEFNLAKLVSDFTPLFGGSNSTVIAALSSRNTPAQSAMKIKALFTGEKKDFYINKFSEFLNALGAGLSNKDYFLPSNIDKTIEVFVENFKPYSNVFFKLTLTNQINNALAKNGKPTIVIKGPLTYIANSDNQVFPDGQNFSEDVQEVINSFVTQNKLAGKGIRDANTFKGFLAKKETEAKRLIEYISTFDIELRPSSYLTADDKKKFTRGPWFYLTQTTKAINEAKNYEELINTPGFERFDYRRNPDVIGSLWLNRLFGLPTTLAEIEANPLNSYTKRKKFGLPVEIEVRDYNGLEIKKFESKVGQTTTDLHPGDKILQDFLGFFQSTEMENIRFGDKSRSLSTSFSNPVLGEKIYVPIVPSKLDGLGGDEADLSAKKVFLETMTNYLAGEFNRVLDLIENPQGANTTYHKQGKDLFIFSSIIPEIASAVKDAKTREDIQKLYDQAVQILPERLDAYFNKEAKNLVKEIVKTLSFPVNSRGQIASQAERLSEAVTSLNKLKFINTQLLPKGVNPKVTKENIEYLAETYLKNGFIHNVEFMKVFVGNMGNFNKLAKDAREAFKRIPFTSSPGIPPFWDSALEEFFEEDINQDAISIAMTGVEHKFNPVVRTVIYNDVLTFTDEEFATYKEVYDSGLWDSLAKSDKFEYSAYVKKSDEEGNAQGLITLDFYRNYLISIEGWSDDQEAAYNDQVRIAQIGSELKTNPTNAEELIEERNNLINKQGIVPFPPLKLGHYGPIVEDPKLNALHKYSLIPIVPSAVLGKQLEKQLELMYKNQIDYYTFKSGSKMADFGELLDFYKEVDSPDGKIKVVNDALSNANVTSIHLQNLRQQQYQAPKFKETSTLSTQMMKLVFGDFYEFGQLSEDFSEETQAQVSNLYDTFKKTVKDMVAFEQVKLERKLGITRDAQGNITSLNQLQLASYITKEFEKNEVPESLRKFIQIDESGNLKYPLDAIKDRSQIESTLLNFINNKVINQKVHGESYIQVAGVGFERRRFAKPTAEQLAEYGANELQFYRFDPATGKTLPMEVKIGFNPEKHAGLLKLTYKDKPVGNLQTLNEILKSNSPLAALWREKHKDLITMAGVRIPVQGFQSMEHVIIKEFLPESSGAVMILPAQIVVKSGGDYDIDKLTFFETAYDENGKIVSNEFNLEAYKSKLEEQRDLKREKQRLVSISRLLREELETNPAYARRKDLKEELKKLNKEVEKSSKALNELLDRPEITPEDKAAGLDKLSEKVETRSRAIADLRATNQSVDFKSLGIISQVRSDLAEINQKINEIENYKKGITNNLVSTLKEVLSIGQLYDYLVAPNNNNVLTEYAGKGVTISTTNVFNPMTSWRIYAENILSKDALGIDAKINTMQKEFQLANLKYKSPLLNMYFLKANRDADGNISLGGKKGQDDNRISKVLSEFINGHVDIAKEDWIILLGMNQETSPLAHAMILAGTPIKDVIAFIKSSPVQLVLEMGNRSKIDSKINKRFTSKYSSIKKLLLASIDPIKDIELKTAIVNLQKGQKDNKVKGKESVQQFIELLIQNPKIQEHLTNFDPTRQLATSEDIAYRNIAYLLQFGVVIAQQESLRELTSVADFNTANYRTTFQSTELVQKKEGLKDAFNPEAIEFIFKDSALAQFNVGSFTLDVMTQIFPLTDSPEVHERLGKMLEYADITETEEKRKAIDTYKNNILYTYVAMFGNRPDGTSYLEYYRGEKGQFIKGIPGNILERYQELATNPDLRTNFLFSNLYVDEESLNPLSREVVFSIRNIETSEYAKEYREAFLEGMNHADEKVRNFFKDLALGSFMQNGAHFNQGKVSTVVPFEAYIDLTTDAYNKLMEMKKNNPETFGRYLSLVGFNTSIKVNSSDSLLLPLPSFLSAYSPISIDMMGILNPELVGKVQILENKVREAVTGEKPTEVKPVVSTQPSTQVQGINISTKSSDKLGKELTNPNWGANYIMDIEAEYKANASKIKAPQLSMEEALRFDMNLMYKLQMKKFANHPELVQEITNRGGVKFLEASEHTVGVKGSRWEGKGTDSNFIKVLIRSYQDSLKTTQSPTSVNPLVAAGVKPTDMAGNAAKDIQMAAESTQFIGFQSGQATVSSTNKYREAWGNKANTGKYSASDVVMVSGSGLFRGVTEAQIKETLTNKYKPLLELAVQAGASFRVGNQYAKGNLSDELIAKYLKAKGYQEEKLPGYSRWTPKMDSDSLASDMFSNEPPVTPDPPSGPTLTPPDNKAPEVDNGLDKGNDKGNMGPLNFTEVSCQLSLGL
jgi:hypothetical protein